MTYVVPDTTPPVINITSPADGSTVNTDTVTLAYTATDDSGATPTCSPAPGPVTLVEGPNVITVTCQDGSGNTGSASVTVTYVPVVVTPETQITDFAEPSALSSAPGTFSFDGTNATSFECRIDGGSWTACTSPFSLPTGLTSPIEHTYEVRALNNTTPDPSPSIGFIWIDDRAFNATATATAMPNSLEPTAADANDAGAHPNIAASLTLQGYDDPKSADIPRRSDGLA
ncbi:MAG: Ig-like domain-containing protein [Actinobacteria bacterium]|nr:Ig-like domain-containing protein [Actinomycetota bacterium]